MSKMFMKLFNRTFSSVAGRRHSSTNSVPVALYNNVWKKSNVFYITYILISCVALESIYGTLTNFIWESCNRGKLYNHIDWSKFKSEDEEED